MSNEALKELAQREYRFGFTTELEEDRVPPGLDEGVIRFISQKKGEPDWLTQWRLKAFRHWQKMTEPTWANVSYPAIDYQAITYYSAPKSASAGPTSLADVDPEILAMYDKLGISLREQERLQGIVPAAAEGVQATASPGERDPTASDGDLGRADPEAVQGVGTAAGVAAATPRPRVAVDAVIDSVSVATTFKEELQKLGIIFCSFTEAVHNHPELVKKYLGTVVPPTDNFFAALNSAVFTDGSFCYVPPGVRCPMELSTYFRINAAGTGQFERTLLIADKGAYVSYLEGCTAPQRDENQLHAAVVELIAHEDAQIKYSTVQNWYPGDKNGKGGIYNFVTKRGLCEGARSKISWTQVETGSAITWKYPSCILKGDHSQGEFYSVALTTNMQQADTGTKMIHIGKDTSSTIISKGISAGRSQNTYRGQVRILKGAEGARNYSQCDSLLIGSQCGAHTFPFIDVHNPTARMEHEATTSKVGEDQIFYLRQRGLSEQDAVNLIVNGFCKDVFRELPMEFAVEAQNLLSLKLEGAVG